MDITILLMGSVVLIGLVVGRFICFVVESLPSILERYWAQKDQQEGSSRFGCVNVFRNKHECSAFLRDIWLLGCSAQRRDEVGLRYALVVIATATWVLFCAVTWGLKPAALAYSVLGSTLLTLALIDWDCMLLPDCLTLPLMCAGIIVNTMGWTAVSFIDSACGAVVGYLSLWLVFWCFKLVTGKDGMGYGDFKLLGALGAWLGWQALLPILFVASLLGAVVGNVPKFCTEDGYMPFGPLLIIGSVVPLVVGPGELWAFLLVALRA